MHESVSQNWSRGKGDIPGFRERGEPDRREFDGRNVTVVSQGLQSTV